MKHIVLLATLGLMGSWLGQAHAAYPFVRLEQRVVCYGTQCNAWNGAYYAPEVGVPQALVVPPHSFKQTSLGSTLGASHADFVCPQFRRDYPAGSTYLRTFQPAPVWPSDTQQMGYYYVRGPWR
jgi:hypothetical protein